MEDDEERATLDEQFLAFAKSMETGRDATKISLYLSDYWMRQAKVLDDRKLTMTDTGLMWMQFNKRELTYEEWYEYLTEICYIKDLKQQDVEDALTNCGLPGAVQVIIPMYRAFFDTYVPPDRLVNY